MGLPSPETRAEDIGVNFVDNTRFQCVETVAGPTVPARHRSRLGIVSGRFARHALLLLCAVGLTTAPVHAQSCAVPGASGNASVSGIVNTYYVPAAGTYAGASSIAISGARGSATAFAAGDLALVIQMQCANINAVNTAAYGGSGTNGNGYTDPASGCLAGLYEYAPVASFTAGTLSFSAGLQNTYIQDATTATNRRTFQVIRVPQYSSATLSGGVTASYWDGSTGGVVAMDVAGQLAWGGQTIDVAGRGFRGGGGIDQSGFALSGTTIPPYLSNNTTPQHASKGEGIAGTPRQVWDPQTAATVDLGGTWGGYANGNYGRGAPGNAGGGGANYDGTRDNGGGGGGGNGGAGGHGGLGWRSAGWTDAAATAAGYPNVPVDNTTVYNLAGRGAVAFGGASAARLVLGGGGGSGAENNNNSAGTFANGGAGGGIVMVRAGSMTGGATINANGLDGGTQTGRDAGGGGGAGGSVLVWSAAGTVGTLNVNASGGAGGNSYVGGTTAHAGGGGGGAGVLYVSSTTNVTPNVTIPGGANGVTNCADIPAAQCSGGTAAHGATPGGSRGVGGTTGTTGTGSGASCLPRLTVSKSTSTPSRTLGVNTTATYAITVTNATGTGTATGVNVVDDLPNPFTYTAAPAPTVAYAGGASGPASPIGGITTGTDPVTFGTAGGTAANSFTIPAGGSVTIGFTVNLNGAGLGTYQNPANANFLDPTRSAAGQTVSPGGAYATGGGTAGGSNYAAASSTAEDVTITAVAPTVAKAFAPASIAAGGTSVVTITLTNNNATAATLTSALVDTLPAGVTLANATFGGTCTGAKSGVAGGTTVTYAAGATIPGGAPGSCTITANVTSSTAGTVTNTIAAGDLQTSNGSNTAAATANLTVTANAPTVAKAFAPATITSGGTSVLTITLTNNNAVAATLSAALVDTLPAGVTLANATFGGTCTGTKSGVAGGNTVTYASGATIPGGAPGTCTITANVTSSTPGTVTNTIAAGALQTGFGNNAAAATANLTVTANAPTVAKSFAPATITSGGTSLLTITLTNNNATAATLSTALVDTLPAGVTLANATFGGTCTGTVTGTAGGSTVTYASGATIPGGAPGSCTITANVTSSTPGVATNTIAAGALQTSFGNNAAAASATLTVTANAPTVTKAFAPASIAVGSTSVLTITLTNNNATAATLSAALVDTLPAGVTLANATFGGTCTGTKSGVAGGSTVTYASGATVPGGAPGTCTITANVTSSTAGTVTNTIAAGALQTNNGNNATAATANLTITANAPTVAKAFAPTTIVSGGTSVLTITLANNNATVATLSANLVDTLPAGVTLANATFGGTCTGTKSGVAGGTIVTYASGSTIPAGAPGSCTITANVTSSTPGTVTNTIAAGALQTSLGNNATAATANLTVNAPPALTVTKSATPAVLVVGGTGQVYTITISVANGPTTAAINVSDVLPAGVTTNGAITATGGTLSGCPASGATSLAGCTVASGTNGPVVITVPVAVAANAANPTVNTATVTGGGDPTCTNCSGTTTNPVIDAVNDTSTGQPGQAGTFNVSTNDKFPVGSTFTQTATTCVPAGTMTGAGVASFTYPGTTGASCTVTYSVCAPAPNNTICDTAILTVTAGAAPDLTPTFTFGSTSYTVGQTREVIININEINGVTTAGPVTFFVPQPQGVAFDDYVFNPTQTNATTLSGSPAVDNVNWTAFDNGVGLVFTLKDATPGVPLTVPANGRRRIVIQTTARDPGGKGAITVNIQANSGGELRTNNNVVVLLTSVQR